MPNLSPSLLFSTALLLALAIGVVMIYNRLVARRHHASAAWSDIDVQLKRRHDLLPKLAAAVGGYADFEAGVQQSVAALRRLPAAPAERAAIENGVTGTLGALLAVAEAYPELKTSEQFLALQTQISEVEEQIQYARRYFNGAVRELNILVQSFPSNLVARLTGFESLDYFRIGLATQRESPDLEFVR